MCVYMSVCMPMYVWMYVCMLTKLSTDRILTSHYDKYRVEKKVRNERQRDKKKKERRNPNTFLLHQDGRDGGHVANQRPNTMPRLPVLARGLQRHVKIH